MNDIVNTNKVLAFDLVGKLDKISKCDVGWPMVFGSTHIHFEGEI
jgi:hypothetical protein